MRRIPIAFLIDTITDRFGGTESQLVMLLQRLDRKRFLPYLCCLRDSSWLQANQDLCRIYIVGFHSFFSPRNYLALWRFRTFLRRERIKILQSHFRDSNIIAALVGRAAQVATLIATRRNLGYWHNWLELGLVRLLNPLATAFLVNSETIRRYVQNVERVPESRIKLIYNGVVLDPYCARDKQARGALRTGLGVPHEAPMVTLVGNLRAVKGIDMFLRAAATVLQRHTTVHFVIVGDGPERTSLQELAKELGIQDRVHLTGTRKDVPAVLLASDVGVLSSLSEGLSNAVIEYMAAGLPVVATAVGGNSELVEDGVTGYLVPPGDAGALAGALTQLLDNSDDMKRFGSKAAHKAHDLFDVDRCVATTEQYYSDFCRTLRSPVDGSTAEEKRVDYGAQ